MDHNHAFLGNPQIDPFCCLSHFALIVHKQEIVTAYNGMKWFNSSQVSGFSQEPRTEAIL